MTTGLIHCIFKNIDYTFSYKKIKLDAMLANFDYLFSELCWNIFDGHRAI